MKEVGKQDLTIMHLYFPILFLVINLPIGVRAPFLAMHMVKKLMIARLATVEQDVEGLKEEMACHGIIMRQIWEKLLSSTTLQTEAY